MGSILQEWTGMKNRNAIRFICIVFAATIALPSGAARANLLATPGFEASISDKITFGYVIAEPDQPLRAGPVTRGTMRSTLADFSDDSTATRTLQSLSALSRHSIPRSLKNHEPGGIAFHLDLGSGEELTLEDSFAIDVWQNHSAVAGIVPAGTVQFEAFVRFLHPTIESGSIQLDTAALLPEQGD